MRAYDFETQLAVEDTYAQLAQQALERFFPGANVVRNASGATEQQFNGEDYLVTHRNGRTYTVDAKADTYEPNNLVIECWHHYDSGRESRLGWAHLDTTNDYVLYQFVKHGISYLLPKERLTEALRAYQDEWLKEFRVAKCSNGTYRTHSILVPATYIESLFGSLCKIVSD